MSYTTTQIIVALIVAIPTIIFGILNSRKIQQVHLLVNSRFDEFVKAEKQISYDEGVKGADVKEKGDTHKQDK